MRNVPAPRDVAKTDGTGSADSEHKVSQKEEGWEELGQNVERCANELRKKY